MTPDAWEVPRPYRVTRRRRDTAVVTTLDLTPADAGPQAPFAPGQFNMVYAFGIGEVPLSISGDPRGPASLAHTVKQVGAVTRRICGLRPGDVVGIRGPFGVGWPVEPAEQRDVLVLAGGVGLAPLRPALHHLAHHRDRYRRVVLVYATRSPADILFRGQLAVWRRQGIEVQVTVDRAGAGWRGHVGSCLQLLPYAAPTGPAAMAFICGPEVMMRFGAGALERLGFSDDHIYLSLERNMRCAQGLCGHCQFGAEFVCKDGPVFPYRRVRDLLAVREL